jgi:hypothetical protein
MSEGRCASCPLFELLEPRILLSVAQPSSEQLWQVGGVTTDSPPPTSFVPGEILVKLNRQSAFAIGTLGLSMASCDAGGGASATPAGDLAGLLAAYHVEAMDPMFPDSGSLFSVQTAEAGGVSTDGISAMESASQELSLWYRLVLPQDVDNEPAPEAVSAGSGEGADAMD